MSTLVLLVVLLLVLVVGLVDGAVFYAVHRSPSLSSPVIAGLTAVGALAAVVGVIVAVGGR